MNITNVEINYLAVLVAGIAAMLIGAAWYSPLLFAKQWMKLTNLSEKDMDKAKANKSQMNKLYAASMFANLTISYVMAHFVYYMHATNVIIGIKLALWAWVGFSFAFVAQNYLFENRPWKLFAIYTGHSLAVLLVTAVILSIWH